MKNLNESYDVIMKKYLKEYDHKVYSLFLHEVTPIKNNFFDYIDSSIHRIIDNLRKKEVIGSHFKPIKLGQGGFGVAYKVDDKTLKITTDEWEYDTAKELIKLKHKNIYNVTYAKKFIINKQGEDNGVEVYAIVYDYLYALPVELFDVVISFAMKDARFKGKGAPEDYLRDRWLLNSLKKEINDYINKGYSIVRELEEFDYLLYVTLELFFGKEFKLRDILSSKELIYIDQLNDADKFCEDTLGVTPDWHPSNVMYNKKTDQLVLIDLGTDI